MVGAALGIAAWSSRASAQPADPAALLATLMALEKGSWQFVKDKNVAGMQNYLADDALLIFAEGTRYGKAAFVKSLADFTLDSFTIDPTAEVKIWNSGRCHLALPAHLYECHEERQGGHVQGDVGQHLRPPRRQMVERALSGDSHPMKILVIHGAGMNMRGKAQVEIFGPMTLPEYDAKFAPMPRSSASRSRSSIPTSKARSSTACSRRTTKASPAPSSIPPVTPAAIRPWSPPSAMSASRRSRSTSPTRPGAAPCPRWRRAASAP